MGSPVPRRPLRWLVGGGVLVLGLADLLAFNSRCVAVAGLPAVGVAVGWMTLAGFPAVAAGADPQTLVQAKAEDSYRWRVFGALRSTGIVPVLSASAVRHSSGA